MNGNTVACEKYNIDGRNYFKLRDLAYLLNGTGSQFDVGWDPEKQLVTITTLHAYTAPDNHELEQRGDLSADARRSASIMMRSSMSISFGRPQIDWITKTSRPRTLSAIRTKVSPSGKFTTSRSPSVVPRDATMACARAGFDVPE